MNDRELIVETRLCRRCGTRHAFWRYESCSVWKADCPRRESVVADDERAQAHAAIGLAVELIRSGLNRREIVPILVRMRADPGMVVLQSDIDEADIRIDFALAKCGMPLPGFEPDELDDLAGGEADDEDG